MPEFIAQQPIRMPVSQAEELIGHAWLAQFRGTAWTSRLIQYGTGGPHSHSAMLRRNGTRDEPRIDLLEVREWYGGRATPLRSQVERYPNIIDVFRPNAGDRWDGYFLPERAENYMRKLTGRKYGYRSLLRIALRKIPGLWRLYPIETNDVRPLNPDRKATRPFCSHAVCLAYRDGGGIDPVPRCPDYLVSPNDLTHSLFFEYQFTLFPG